MIRVRLKCYGLQRKVEILKRELPKEAERALRGLAQEAVALVRDAPEADKRALVTRQVERSLDAVFIPVQLKHKRREAWPTLAPIYQARIVRGQRTYQGRKLFWVDQTKRDDLAAQLIAHGIEKRAQHRYEVRFVATSDRRYRLEIIALGGKRVPPVVIAYAKQNMRVLAASTLASAMSRAGLMNGRSATRYSHRFY